MSENFDPLDMAKKSKTFCILPWIHQYVGPKGDIKPCCVYDLNAEIGNLKTNTLNQIWNNQKTKEIRLKFLNGQEDENCWRCNSRKEFSTSFRDDHNRTFSIENEKIKNAVLSTNPDGSVDNHQLLYIDVRYNNLCNFACRTCGPIFSTNWIIDHQKLYKYSSKDDIGYKFPGATKFDALDQILPHLKNVIKVYFAGGEPLITEEHYVILEELIKLNRNLDVELFYTTNFSKLRLGEHDVIEYWKQFKNVFIMASLDGTGLKAEYWRHGTVWEDIVNNRQEVMLKIPHVEFGIGATLTWPNVYNLLELHKEWTELGYIDIEDIEITCADTPSYYNIKNIPIWKKEKIESLILDHISWLKDNSVSTNKIKQFEEIIQFMYTINPSDFDLHESLKEFSRITKTLDNIRKESFFDTFPEHIDINDYMTENNLHYEFTDRE